MRILLVEDDVIISENIKILLNRKGYSTDIAVSIEEAYQKISSEDYDILVLDRGLSDGDGIDLIPKIRSEEITTPILVLTARNEDNDIVEGLNNGADDYLSKPFEMNILLARIKALTRRVNKIPIKPLISIGKLNIDMNNAIVKFGNIVINLSPREYALLEYLTIHKDQILDRTTLLSHVWDENTDMFSNTVDVHIKYLRNKIDSVFNTKFIKTIRGKGYMISEK